MYGLDVFDSWLYDDCRPFDYLHFDVFEKLREDLDKGYFESLIRTYLLENTHGSFLVAEPRRGLTAEHEEEVCRKLSAFKESLSAEERRKLVE